MMTRKEISDRLVELLKAAAETTDATVVDIILCHVPTMLSSLRKYDIEHPEAPVEKKAEVATAPVPAAVAEKPVAFGKRSFKHGATFKIAGVESPYVFATLAAMCMEFPEIEYERLAIGGGLAPDAVIASQGKIVQAALKNCGNTLEWFARQMGDGTEVRVNFAADNGGELPLETEAGK